MSLSLDKSTWKRVAFGDVIEHVTDRVDNPSEAHVDRYVGLEHLEPGVMTVRRWDTPDKVEAQKLRFQPGDVIFGRRRAYQKKVALAEFEGICSAHALVLRARPDYVHPDFLPVFVSSDYFLDRAIAISVGSLSPTVNWQDLEVQEFDLPPLDEQKRIAELPWAAERHRLRLEALAKAMTRTAAQLVEDVRRTSTGKMLGDVATIRNGQTFPKSLQGRPSGDIGFFKIADLERPGNERFLTNAENWISNADAGELKAELLPAGTIVTARVGAAIRLERRRALGIPALVDDNHLVIRPHSADPDFLLAVLSETALARNGNDGVVPSLNQKIVGSVSIPALATSDEKRLGRAYRRTLDSRDRITEEVSSLSRLRSSLMADIFGGN